MTMAAEHVEALEQRAGKTVGADGSTRLNELPGWDAERGVYVMCRDPEPSSSYDDVEVAPPTTTAQPEGPPSDTAIDAVAGQDRRRRRSASSTKTTPAA